MIMMFSERDLWLYVKDGLTSVGVELQRIETGITSQGVFDINALYQGTEIWIELKYKHGPLRPEQKAWCVRRLEYGGRAWIISGKGTLIELWNGRDAVIHKHYPKQPNHIFPRPVRWQTLRDTLFGELMVWTGKKHG